jgi:hypothetical protein
MPSKNQLLLILTMLCISFIMGIAFYPPQPEVLDMEMIAMLRELYGDDLVRKEFGEAVLEECKKVDFFPDSEMRKYFPYDYEDDNGHVTEEKRKEFEKDREKGLAVEDGNYTYKRGRFADRK